MEVKLKAIITRASEALKLAKTTSDLSELRNEFLSKKSELSQASALMKDLSSEERVTFGKLLNDTKNTILSLFEEKTKEIETIELSKRLSKEKIDISLPSRNYNVGYTNPFNLIKDEMVSIFLALGYTVEEGPEVEEDRYNFELLNIPKNHPARGMQDTFYIDENYLMRTHTSPVQVRVMEKANGQPIRIICPGKVYRRDDDDQTHSHQFGQIEGLLIDKDITLGHLKATLELFVKKLFGENRAIRLRSSYFPFTEPSVEVDVSCAACGGKGCPMCKGTGYIEILGAGMVHPNVLRMSGYDPEVYSGFAFGIGIERLAILRYGIDDIRRFYQNDLRFLKDYK